MDVATAPIRVPAGSTARAEGGAGPSLNSPAGLTAIALGTRLAAPAAEASLRHNVDNRGYIIFTVKRLGATSVLLWYKGVGLTVTYVTLVSTRVLLLHSYSVIFLFCIIGSST
jgi:hypothetical protein